MNKFRFISVILIGSMTFMGCATSKSSSKADKLASQGQLAQAAQLQEQIASKHTGKDAAKAWYQAGNLWLDPDNPQKSYSRALTCFNRVDRTKVDKQMASSTRSWISVLTQLASVKQKASTLKEKASTLKETAAALKDAAAGSEQLHKAVDQTK